MLSPVQLFGTLWTAAHQASLLVHHQLLELTQLMSIHSLVPSNHFSLCCPLLLLPSTVPSIRVFSNELVLHIRWPKYWSFSFSISASNEYSGLISVRIDWFDLLAVQGTPNSILHCYSSNSTLLQCSTFMVQLTSMHDYWKNYSFDEKDFYWHSNVSAF